MEIELLIDKGRVPITKGSDDCLVTWDQGKLDSIDYFP